MKELRIKVTGIRKQNPLFFIDGKEVAFKKNQFGSYDHTVRTEADSVNIKIKTLLELSSRWWFAAGIFFFIISIFGIFDYRFPKNCATISLDVNAKLKNERDEISIHLFKSTGQKTCAEVRGEVEFEEVTNAFVVDPVAQKRRKSLRTAKLFLFLASAATIITLLFTGII